MAPKSRKMTKSVNLHVPSLIRVLAEQSKDRQFIGCPASAQERLIEMTAFTWCTCHYNP